MTDDQLIETFRTEGAVALPGLLSLDDIQQLRDAMPDLLHGGTAPDPSMGGDPTGPKMINKDGLWRENGVFARFLFNSPLGDTAARFLRASEVRLYEDLLIYKEAGPTKAGGWHRDSVHWPVKGDQLCSIWFSLETVTKETGAMNFVAGSHLDSDDVIDVASVSISDESVADRRKITIETEPGDAVLFHPRIIHRGYGSAPDHPRRTFTIRFMGDDVRWRPRRSMLYPWMQQTGMEKGDPIDHPWFPVLGHSKQPALIG